MVEIPNYDEKVFFDKKSEFALCIPVINEGDKIKNQLLKIKENKIDEICDIIICDGGSTDGSLNDEILETTNVRVLLTKKDVGKLSAQLRMGYFYALNLGYKGIITIDGNGKDNVEAIKDFVKKLQEGYDLIQGSRFLPGGKAINTPKIRHLAVKLLHIPIISFKAGFKYSDTTNGYRGYSANFLNDKRVLPFRKIFDTYELLAYLSVRAPKLGFKVCEIPVTRTYPKNGKTPTKISFIKGNYTLLKILFEILIDKYNPKEN